MFTFQPPTPPLLQRILRAFVTKAYKSSRQTLTLFLLKCHVDVEIRQVKKSLMTKKNCIGPKVVFSCASYLMLKAGEGRGYLY